MDARVVVAKALAADKFAAWCAQLPPGCLVALEACGGAHHWARKLRGYGLDARLIAGHFVTPYRMAGKGRKNGAADAAAICEAATRPHMRFVPVKPPAQTLLTSHQLRKTDLARSTAMRFITTLPLRKPRHLGIELWCGESPP